MRLNGQRRGKWYVQVEEINSGHKPIVTNTDQSDTGHTNWWL